MAGAADEAVKRIEAIRKRLAERPEDGSVLNSDDAFLLRIANHYLPRALDEAKITPKSIAIFLRGLDFVERLDALKNPVKGRDLFAKTVLGALADLFDEIDTLAKPKGDK